MLVHSVSIETHNDIEKLIDVVTGIHGVEAALAAGFGRSDALGLWMVLSEVAQNVAEHAGAPGTVTVEMNQTGCHVSVSDEGMGFAGSLGIDDAAEALSLGFLQGRSRFADPGRGQGLKQIRRRIARWSGQIDVHSGSARVEERTSNGASTQHLHQDVEPVAGTHIRLLIPPRTAHASHG